MFTWWVYNYLYQLDCISILLLIYILIESNFLIQEWTFTPPDPEKLPSIPSSVSIVTYQYMYWHILHLFHCCINWNILHLLHTRTYSKCHAEVHTGTLLVCGTLEHTVYWFIQKHTCTCITCVTNLYTWRAISMYHTAITLCLYIYMFIIFLYTDRQLKHWKGEYHAN